MKNVLFDNYDIDTYLDMAKESMEDSGFGPGEITDSKLYAWAEDLAQEDFTDTMDELKSFFDGKTVMFTGPLDAGVVIIPGLMLATLMIYLASIRKIVIISIFTTIMGRFTSVVLTTTGLIFSRFLFLQIKGPVFLKTGKIM